MDQSTINETPTIEKEDIANLRKGIKLPKSNSKWSTANEHFKFALQSNDPSHHKSITSQDLNSNIKLLNNIIYDYFAQNFGYSESVPDNSLLNKYKDYEIRDLKKALKTIKSTSGELDEIKYVSLLSHILRDKLRSNNNNESSLDRRKTAASHLTMTNIGRNFWGYVKNILSKKDTVLPSFNMTQCLSHFTKTLAAIQPNKLFNIPSWIPALSDPEIQFDLDPPSYQQVTNIIRRTKASGCPCPLDQLSVICFKRCPFLRTYLTDLIRAVWLSGTIPSEWKKACTILIHKKGDTNTPSHWRPYH